MEDRPSILREMRICRFCLTENEPLTNIYVKDKNNTTPLPLQIMACVALEVFANDGMPQLICDSCRIQTRKSYTFKTICKRSDDALKLYLATGVLKRGDTEIEVNKNIKRNVKEENVQVQPKRRKVEEHKKSIESSTNIKQEKDNPVAGNIPENEYEQQSEEVPPENIQEISPAEIVECVHETAAANQEIEKLQKEEVTDVSTVEVVNQIKVLEGNEYVIQQELVPQNNVVIQNEVNQSTIEETADEVNKSVEMLFPKVQILTDPTVEGEVIEYDETEIQNEIVLSQHKVPQIVPQVVTQCFPCPSCERSFPLQQLLDIHMRQHTRERKFVCSECGKRFFSKHDLTKHSLIHTGDKPFSCIICDKSFSRATLLHRHEKVHISVPKYLCTYCDKTYLASEDLDAHMRTHKKIRPFQCSQCDKRFAFKQGLERHENTHIAENPHKCNYCDETFSTPSKLQRHITCHAGARPYPCKLCPRTFLLSHHLTRHLRNHYTRKNKVEEGGEYKCDVCSMSFKRRFSLINHSAIHSMVNLKCVICNKEFEDAQTVKQHITSHLSGLPFLCFKCEYSFENEEDLLEHEQKHFGESDSGSDGKDECNEEVENINNSKENTTDATPQRRSQRERKVKNYADFLKDEDFSDMEENLDNSDEDYVNTTNKANSIQPVVRSETMKVYKRVKDKIAPKLETSTPIIPQTVLSNLGKKLTETVPKEPKTLTKITTLENLGLSKSTLDAMTDKSGFVEMKIGQKVIRVQKLMMTKADVQAMAEQGKIEMKGSKVVVKNTASGILDLNKLTNLGKSSPVTVMEDPTKENVAQKGVRTYVKKVNKRDEATESTEVTETTEAQQPVKEIIIANNIDIDVKAGSTEEVTTSLESNMIAF